MAIELNSFIAIKCVIEGLTETTGSFGPAGTVEGKAVERIAEAPINDLVTDIEPEDWSRVSGLRLKTFVAGDCDALTADIKSAIWRVTLNTAAKYWRAFPLLPNPFPRDKFPEPDMDCDVTTVADLAVRLIIQWHGAQ